MTILQINVTANSGSTGRIAEDIGKIAISNGWDSYIAYGRGKPNSTSNLIRIGNNLDLYCHVFQSRLFDNHGLASTMATRKFIKQIEKIKPDIIHLHNIHGYYLNYKILFEYLAKVTIPIIWTLHDCWPITGHCAYFDFANCNKWKTYCNSCPQKRSYPSALLIDNSKCNYNKKQQLFKKIQERLTIVPVSDWLANIVSLSFLRNCNTCTIHNGIDITSFSPKKTEALRYKYDLKEKITIIGVANPWSQRKGLSDFLKLRDLLPVDKYAIILVGLSTKQIQSIPKTIIGLKRTGNVEELSSLYSIANVFVNMTYEDNYPTVNLEAISCGIPIITYNTGGCAEAVSSEVGFAVNRGDINSIVKHIDIIAKKGKSYYENICRNYALKNFDKNICFKKYLHLYETVLHNQKQ